MGAYPILPPSYFSLLIPVHRFLLFGKPRGTNGQFACSTNTHNTQQQWYSPRPGGTPGKTPRPSRTRTATPPGRRSAMSPIPPHRLLVRPPLLPLVAPLTVVLVAPPVPVSPFLLWLGRTRGPAQAKTAQGTYSVSKNKTFTCFFWGENSLQLEDEHLCSTVRVSRA